MDRIDISRIVDSIYSFSLTINFGRIALIIALYSAAFIISNRISSSIDKNTKALKELNNTIKYHNEIIEGGVYSNDVSSMCK